MRALVARLRHPDALVRKVLLNMLTYIYTKHQYMPAEIQILHGWNAIPMTCSFSRCRSPKQLVELHKLEPVLRALKTDDPSILVRQLASELHNAFATHDIL